MKRFMNEFLYNLNLIAYITLLILSAAFFLIVKVYKRHSSLAITVAIAIVFELLSFIMRTKILTLPFEKETVRFIWFNGFAFVASLAFYFMYKIHALYKVTPKIEAKMVALTYAFFSVFEICIYIDYSFIESGLGPPIYQILTPTIGLFVAIKLCWKLATVVHDAVLHSNKQEI